jgi:hypothetical protein
MPCTIPHVFTPMTIEELFEASSEVDCSDRCVDLGQEALKDRERPIERVRLMGVVSAQDPGEFGACRIIPGRSLAVPKPNTEHFVLDGETAKVVVQVVHEPDETTETQEMKQSAAPGQRAHVFGRTFLCPVGPHRVIVVLADAVRVLSPLPEPTEDPVEEPADGEEPSE